jgi:hypothetical protein
MTPAGSSVADRGPREAVTSDNPVAPIEPYPRPGVSSTDKYRHQPRMAAMDIRDEHDELTGGDDAAAYRARAATLLNNITQQTKQSLNEQGIDLPIFFTVPSSGRSVLTFGTVGDPCSDVWNKVERIVSSIVRRKIGLERTRCRSLLCATTRDQA